MIYKVLFSFVALVLSWQANAQSDFKTHYQVFGQGDPILIINGGPGMNSNGFADMAKTIAKLGYMTIIYDQRGTGQSVLPKIDSTSITMDLMVMDIENLRKELKISKWTVLGHSFGGLLACHYYSKYPENINKLIFSSSGGVNMNFVNYLQSRIQNNLTKTQRDSLSFYQNKIAAGDTSLETRKGRVASLANAYIYDKKFAALIASRLLELNRAVNAIVINDLNRINFDYTNKFLESRTPVLVIQGQNDIISIETAIEIKKSFGNAKLKILKNCAHYGWLDQPTAYFEAIDKFLKS